MLRPLRYARLWFVIGIFILAIALYLNLAPQVPGPEFRNADKLEHLVGWAGLTVWFGSVLQRRLFAKLASVRRDSWLALVEKWLPAT